MTTNEQVQIDVGDARLDGDLSLPDDPSGVVLFAHGSGSSRHSPRNRQVARALQEAGYATLLLDLLTSEEDEVDQRTREHRFDIALLAGRLTGAADWLRSRADTAPLRLAVFGASTGAAAALITAADRPEHVRLVVSRGGRVDLAGEALERVEAPVLMLVGEHDTDVRRLNDEAATHLPAPTVQVVPGAGHLFEEPGALEAVVEATVAALEAHLRSIA